MVSKPLGQDRDSGDGSEQGGGKNACTTVPLWQIDRTFEAALPRARHATQDKARASGSYSIKLLGEDLDGELILHSYYLLND